MKVNPLPFVALIQIQHTVANRAEDTESEIYERVFQLPEVPHDKYVVGTGQGKPLIRINFTVLPLIPTFGSCEAFAFVVSRLHRFEARWSTATTGCLPASDLAIELTMAVAPGQSLVVESTPYLHSELAKRSWLGMLARILRALFSQLLSSAVTRIRIFDDLDHGLVVVGYIGTRPHFLYNAHTDSFELVDFAATAFRPPMNDAAIAEYAGSLARRSPV